MPISTVFSKVFSIHITITVLHTARFSGTFNMFNREKRNTHSKLTYCSLTKRKKKKKSSLKVETFQVSILHFNDPQYRIFYILFIYWLPVLNTSLNRATCVMQSNHSYHMLYSVSDKSKDHQVHVFQQKAEQNATACAWA